MTALITTSRDKDSESDLEDRELIFSILYDCCENKAFSNLSLGASGADDFVRAAVYGTLTYVYSEDYLIKKVSGRDVQSLDPKIRTILRFGVWQVIYSDKVPDYAAVNTSVDLASKHAPRAKGLVNAVLRKVTALTPEERDLSSSKSVEAAFSLKPEVYGILKKSYGSERSSSIARALLSPSPLAIRVNTLKTSVSVLEAELKEEGFEVMKASFMEDALILKPTSASPSLEKSKAFTQGKFMVQGEAAQLASLVAQPAPGMKILDCCAAPGGKSTHMAALSENKADILALDINSSRTELIRENAARLGAVLRTGVADSSLYDEEDCFDLVLCDAPCSGLGIMGGKPDIRLTINYERITEITQKQKVILDNVSKLVKPGGVLVYSTCTVNRGENEDQVQSFLDSHSDFELDDFDNILPDRLKSSGVKGMLTLLPDTDGCEGFFISRMRRKNG